MFMLSLTCLVDAMRNIPQSMNSIIDFHCWWQIYDVLHDAGKSCGVRSVCVHGGTSKQPQITALQSWCCKLFYFIFLFVFG